MTKVYHFHQPNLFSVSSKVCKACVPPTEKPLDDFYLYKDGTRDNFCKTCILAKNRANYAANREKRLERRRAYRAGRMEQEREIDRNRHERDKEKRNAIRRVENIDPIAHERRLKAHRVSYHTHKHERKEKRREYGHWYHEVNAEKGSAYGKKWRAENPLKELAKQRRRVARIKKATVENVSYERVLERDGYWCYICEQAIIPGATGRGKLNFDHFIPLDKGGAHSENNIKPTHRVCNYRKGRRLFEEMTPFQRRGL